MVDGGRILTMGGNQQRRLCKQTFQSRNTIYQHISRRGTHKSFYTASGMGIDTFYFTDIIPCCSQIKRIVD